MKNSQNGVKRKNIFSNAFNKDNEEGFDKLDDYIYGKDILEEKLKDIYTNIEKIGNFKFKKRNSLFLSRN